MMRIILMIVLLFASSFVLYGQEHSQRNVPITLHHISGILTDSLGTSIVGATINLTSAGDTLSNITNADGIFIFKNIKSSVFTITVRAIGYRQTVRKYSFNDAQTRITLDPIIPGSEILMLQEVKINGTPTIKYKTDTVEYRASDFRVRENANVKELVKKMQGFEVGSDNSLTYMGQKITKAELNGKEYAGGDVALALQTLPADIVEKIQVIDDYGFQAARTGIKNESAKKVVNITTKADKSVGKIFRPTVGIGSQDRLNEQLFAQRINGNRQLGFIGSYRNEVNGIASNTSIVSIAANNTGGGTNIHVPPNGGNVKTGVASMNYRDTWGKHIDVTANYNLNTNNQYTLSSSTGKYFYYLNSLSDTGQSTNFDRSANGHSNQRQHVLDVDLEWSPGKSDFFKITPSLKFNNAQSNTAFAYNQDGYINQLSTGEFNGNTSAPTVSTSLFYQHIFKKPKRNISIQTDWLNGQQRRSDRPITNLTRQDSLQNVISNLSVRRQIGDNTKANSFNTTFTYTEPLSFTSLIDISLRRNSKISDNTRITNDSSNDDIVFPEPIDSLSNSYKFNFTEYRLSLNYHLDLRKFKLSLGGMFNPSKLTGVSMITNKAASTSVFYFLPVFRLQYNWSMEQSFLAAYNGTQMEPASNQIQPVPDYSDTQNPVIGNPNLKPSLRHVIYVNYSHYLANDKLNISANLSTTIFQNQVVPNIVQSFSANLKSYISETRFVNVDGANSILGNYSISKQLDDRKYSLVLNGFVFRDHAITMNNNVANVVDTWRFNERFGPRIEPNDDYEISPFISYEQNISRNSLSGDSKTTVQTWSLSLDGQIHFLRNRTFTIGFDAYKNYISGIGTGLQKNPFVFNAWLERELFKKRNGILKLSVFDLFNQNRLINRTIITNGYIDINSNALSRYFMISFSINLQKWNGAPQKNGQNMKRKGNGSFY